MAREGQSQIRTRPKHGKRRGRFQNSKCNSHIALKLKLSEKKTPKRTESCPPASALPVAKPVSNSEPLGAAAAAGAGRGGASASPTKSAQAPRGRGAGSGGGQLARESGLRLAGNGSRCGTRRKPGWRLRLARLRP